MQSVSVGLRAVSRPVRSIANICAIRVYICLKFGTLTVRVGLLVVFHTSHSMQSRLGLLPIFPLPHFHPLQDRADISTPAISTPTGPCRCFHSCIFISFIFSMFRADISTPAFSTPAFSAPPTNHWLQQFTSIYGYTQRLHYVLSNAFCKSRYMLVC